MSIQFAGLDFGTTNSTLALAGRGEGQSGEPRLLALEGDNRTIPTALFFSLEDGETYFGRKAVHEYVDGAEGRFMRAVKSILGTSLMRETTQVGRERLSFESVIGRFLAHLRGKLEESGAEADHVVLGRPVRFVDEDSAADRAAQGQLEAAARAQGFRHIEFQFEPVAAALFFERGLNAESLALVVDVGGGTSDVSILRLGPERARRLDRADDILATGGVHVGGTDFDRLLNIARIQPLLGLNTFTADGKRLMPVWYFNDLATWHRVNTLYTPKNLADVRGLVKEAAEPEKLRRLEHVLAHRSGHRLAGVAERAKIALTENDSAPIALREPGLEIETEASREGFEQATRELVERIDRAIREALETAGLRPREIDTVILTGGGAQVPAVAAAAARPFPEARVARSDAFGSVGLGLGLDAARRFS